MTLTNATDLVEIYTVSTGDWEQRALSQARAFMAVATVGDKVFFAGGTTNGDIVSNVWISMMQQQTCGLQTPCL